MKKSVKYTGIIAAALLAVAPIAAPEVASVSQPVVVKAATTKTMEELNRPYIEAANADNKTLLTDDGYQLLELTKKTPYLTAYNGETVKTLTKKRITDITAKGGTVAKIDEVSIYPAMDNGDPDLGNKLKAGDKLKAGENYVALIMTQTKLKGKRVIPIYYVDTANGELEGNYWENEQRNAGLLVPVQVSANAPAKKSFSAYGYVTARKNKKVRTYTSTGKFRKHYVYGHHTYKLNKKKNIKGHGTCYKIYGKNQWIPAKYLKLK